MTILNLFIRAMGVGRGGPASLLRLQRLKAKLFIQQSSIVMCMYNRGMLYNRKCVQAL